MKERIHQDLAYFILRGIVDSGNNLGMNFTPTIITYSLPGNAYLQIVPKDSLLVYSLVIHNEEKE